MNLIKIFKLFLNEETETENLELISTFDEKYDQECNFCTDTINNKNILSKDLYYSYLEELEEYKEEYDRIAFQMRVEFNNGKLFEYEIENCNFLVRDTLHFLFHLKHLNGKIKRVLKLKVKLNDIFTLIKKGLEKIYLLNDNKDEIPGNYILILKKDYNGLIKIPVDIKLYQKVEIKPKKLIVKRIKKVNENEDVKENKTYKYYFNVLIPTVLVGGYQEKKTRNDKEIIVERKQRKKYKIIFI